MDSRFVPGSDTNRMVPNNSARPSNEPSVSRRATTTRPMLVEGAYSGVKVAEGHEPVLGKHYSVASQSGMDAFGVVSDHNADIVSRSGGRTVRG